MQIVYQNQLLNVPQRKLTSDTLTFLVELISAILSKIRGYRSMLMDILFTFPGYYCVGEETLKANRFLLHYNYLMAVVV